MKDTATIGILPLGRPTFDVPFAEENLAAMISALEGAGQRLVGPRHLLMDANAAGEAVAALKAQEPDHVLVLQVTFTDASMMVTIAETFDRPLSIWAIPEPRIGGRLRLNSFCGLNLAAHALGLSDRHFSYLYAAPDSVDVEQALGDLLAGNRMAKAVDLAAPRPGIEDTARGTAAIQSLRGAKIGRIGAHPDGFHTCAYDKEKLAALANISVEEMELEELFGRARGVSETATADIRREAAMVASDLDSVDQTELSRSLKLKAAIEDIRAEGSFDAFAIRCWPETFTDYGGAVCGPVSMMGEKRVPCACEADVYGALTTLILQKIADAPAFLTDLVDLDTKDNTGVVWHCGQAPASMADPDEARTATIHTNRKMPLLFQFPLKAGRVTLFRISQARGKTFAVIGGGEMLKRPLAFTGTSGVVRFDSGSETTLDHIMGAALEHHMALAYGDHRNALEAATDALGIPVLRL